MPSLYRSVAAYDVPFRGLNNPAAHQVNCKKADLYRSAITVGNPTFISIRAIRQYGFFPVLLNSIFEKCSIVAVNISIFNGFLRRSMIYDTYVTDKKREVSYSLGMAFAKLHSEKLLGIRNLVHLEFLKQQNAITFIQQPTTKRPREPDLVGQSLNGAWHLFEAKGTTYENTIPSKIIEAKEQVRQILTIRGQLPETRSVAVTYIGLDKILTRIEDPSDSGGSIVDFDDVDFVRSYYAPFLIFERNTNFSATNQIIDGAAVRMYVTQNERGRLSIGLVSNVVESVVTGNIFSLQQELLGLSDLSERGGDEYSFGLDGFVVRFEPRG